MTKSIFGKFRKLEKKKKLQLVIAVSLSAVMLVALPVYAWFTHKRSIALTTKINAPTQLYITAGNKESVANLEMADIDVEDGNYKDFVFGIGGADVQQYQIQLAHTTNIPFEYIPFLLYQFGDGLQINFANALRGIADVRPMMLFSFIAYFLISLPAGYLFGFVCGWGAIGIWAAFPFGLTSAGIMYYLRFRYKTKSIR